MIQEHLKTYKRRKERAQILYEDGRKSSPKYTFIDYLKDLKNRNNW